MTKREKLPVSIEAQIEKLAACGLNNREISDVLIMDENTLKRNYTDKLASGRANLKEKLKRKQIAVALGGNVAMLIWLGKQYLDQSDQVKDSSDIKIVLERKSLEKELEVSSR